MRRYLLTLLLAIAPAIAWAEPFLLDLPPGVHNLKIVVAADGTVTATPLRTVKVGGGPVNPNPPDPTDTPLQSRVKQLTREAIAAGGKPETAAKLAGVYALVSDLCLDGTISPAMVRGKVEKPGFLTAATDKALRDEKDKPLPDAAAWTAWRQGVGAELALRHPAGAETTKEQLADTLREVSGAIKSHLGSQVDAGILDGINWSEILDALRPIIRDLLLKFLTEWIKGL